MEIQQFEEKIINALSSYYKDEVKLESHRVYKNNGILLYGICALHKDSNVAPTVYLNHFYEEYEKGMAFGEVVRQLTDFLDKNQLANRLDVNFFLHYDKVKPKLVYRLIHREKNQELLKEIPYQSFADLAIVCHCLVITEEIGVGSILIHKHHLESWGVSKEQLFQDAEANSPRLEPSCIIKMAELLKDMLASRVEERIEEICLEYPGNKKLLLEKTLQNIAREMEGYHLPMNVLTNTRRYYGAACLAYPGMLRQMGEWLGDDFYIIPSSVHEIIFIGKKEEIGEDFLNNMIEEANRTQVDREEWLSDHAYFYDREKESLISVEKISEGK